MDFKKLQGLVDHGIVIDVEGADEHEVRASNDPGNDNSWKNFMPESYSNEEELVATINNAFRSDRVADDKIYTDYK